MTELLTSIQEIREQFDNIDPVEIVNEISLGNYKNNREFEATPVLENLTFIQDQAETITKIINENSLLVPSGVVEKKLNEQQIKQLTDFVRVVHFDSGS